MRLTPLVGLALLLVPTAAAHVQTYSDARSIAVGPYSASLYPQPTPIYANTSTEFDLTLADGQGRLTTRETATMHLSDPATPTGWDVAFTAGPRGYRSGAVVFPRPGNYSVELTVREGSKAYAGNASLHVYPDLPFRILAPPFVSDPVQNELWRFRFEVLRAGTGELAPEVSDLRMRAERWTDDHTTFLSTTELTLRPREPGVFEGEHTFRDTGMVHVWLASDSGGFQFGDTPMWHVYVTTGVDESSSPNLALPIALGALLVGLLFWRRMRRCDAERE